MPKRKRSADESVQGRFATYRQDLFKALKAAKGLERQRQTKRLRDTKGAAPEKTQRLQKEVIVLKVC